MSSTSNITSEPVAVSADTQAFRTQMGHISRHSGVFFAGTMFTAAAGYLFKVYVARMLGAEALGIFTLGMTMVGLLGIFSAMGLPQSAVRFVAFYKATGKTDALHSFMAHAIGTYLFYAQHNFPDVSFADSGGWTYEKAAMDSSSYGRGFLKDRPIIYRLTIHTY